MGYKSEKDLIGKTDFDFFSEEQAEAIRQIDMQVMKTQKEYCIEETGNNHEGIEKIFLSRKIPLYDIENKKIIGIIGTSLDITDRKLSYIDKHDSLMQIAHDLKNPLDFLNIQPQINRSSQQALSQLIHDASGKLLELINLMVK